MVLEGLAAPLKPKAQRPKLRNSAGKAKPTPRETQPPNGKPCQAPQTKSAGANAQEMTPVGNLEGPWMPTNCSNESSKFRHSYDDNYFDDDDDDYFYDSYY